MEALHLDDSEFGDGECHGACLAIVLGLQVSLLVMFPKVSKYFCLAFPLSVDSLHQGIPEAGSDVHEAE